MIDADPVEAIIGAVGRLTDAGMSAKDATDAVLRIMQETNADFGVTTIRRYPGGLNALGRA